MHATEIDQKGARGQPLWLPGSRSEPLIKLMRTGVVLCLGLFITLGPAVGQIFGHHSVFLREWIMFAGAGIGVLKGNFTLHRSDGGLVRMTPLDVLGLKRYPGNPPYEFEYRVFEDGDLRAFARSLCAATTTSRLSFDGAVGTRQGWRALDVADVCALPPPTAPTEDATKESAS